MASKLDSQVDLKHYFRVLWRRKSLVLLATVAVFCTALIALQLLPSQYQSSAVLSVQERDRFARGFEELMGGGRATQRAYNYDEMRQAQIISDITSRPFLEDVVRVLKMHEDPTLLERAKKDSDKHPQLTVEEIAIRTLVSGLQSRIQVRGVGPGLYRFTVRDYDPGTSKLLAHWISELFIDSSTKREIQRIEAQKNVAEEQLRIREDEVAAKAEALQIYRERLIGQALEENPVTGRNLRSAELRYDDLASDEATIRARIPARRRAAVADGFPTTDARLSNDPEVMGLAKGLREALHAFSLGQLGSNQTSAGVLALQEKLSQARSQLYRTLEERSQTLYGDSGQDWSKMADLVFAQLDAKAHGEAARSLRIFIRDYKSRIQSEPAHEIELARLEKELLQSENSLKAFKEQLIASEVQTIVSASDLGLRIEIVDPAQLPLKASFPNRTKILTLALLMGPLIGIGFGFLNEFLDPTLRNLEDIQRIAPEPVLGTLPLLENVIPVHSGLRKRWVPVTLAGVVLVTVAFFATREMLFPDLGTPKEAVEAVEPVEGFNQ
ncbi:MAG: hypothetical protein HKN21_11840 [Candidatus Eisenbacteria bacterium]|uniref:Polysaccharide chain length determinant N-terminal domain-containing protein n=1 Tax=Eiseniibacteriota bacterium TaxID=2212470 RepID=A0A7Y2H2W3_UNCEI|nr:hypothetical protein [Candidatus Eisenbacteria bacterium]